MKIEFKYDDRTQDLLNSINNIISEKVAYYNNILNTTNSIHIINKVNHMKESDSTLNYLLSIKCKTIETAVPEIIVSAESEEEKRELEKRYAGDIL